MTSSHNGRYARFFPRNSSSINRANTARGTYLPTPRPGRIKKTVTSGEGQGKKLVFQGLTFSGEASGHIRPVEYCFLAKSTALLSQLHVEGEEFSLHTIYTYGCLI